MFGSIVYVQQYDLLYDGCYLLYFEAMVMFSPYSVQIHFFIFLSYLLNDVRVLTISIKFGICYKITVSRMSVNAWKRG